MASHPRLARVVPLLLAASAVALWLRRRLSDPLPALPAGHTPPHAGADASDTGRATPAGESDDVVTVVDDLLGGGRAGARPPNLLG